MINLLFLRTFITLVETRHFTQAAQQLHMTQPGVTQHIQKLEAQLDAALLIRFGKSFELTVAGEKLYEYGVRLLDEQAQLKAALHEDDPYQGICRLACSGAIALRLYPVLLGLQRAHPKLSIQLEAAPNQRIIERIKAYQTDIGIISQLSHDPELEQILLGYEKLTLVVPVGAPTDWEHLQSLGLIDHPDARHYATQVLTLNYPKEFGGMDTVPVSGYVNQIGQILLPVAKGLGFTVIPESVVSGFAEPACLTQAPLEYPVREPLYLTIKKHRQLPQRYQQIIELFQQQWASTVEE